MDCFCNLFSFKTMFTRIVVSRLQSSRFSKEKNKMETLHVNRDKDDFIEESKKN